MKLPELRTASVLLKDNSKLTVLNPQLGRKKGMLILTGFLDKNEFKDDKDLKEKLNFRSGRHTKTYADLFKIEGICGFNESYEMFPVDYNSMKYPSLEIELECYGIFKSTYNPKHATKSHDYIYNVVFEGAKMYHSKSTTNKTERVIFGKEEHPNQNSKKDFTEANMSFYYDNKLLSLDFAFLETDDKLTRMRFANDQFGMEIYDKVKFPLICFLSFAFGNNIVACQEHCHKDSLDISVFHSYKRVKNRCYSNYIPLNNASFIHRDILNDYLKAFNAFLFLDEHLVLSEIILLLNQAKKSPVDTSIFIMLIAMEKLADKYINSPFYNNADQFEIDNNEFKLKVSKLREILENEFQSFKTSNPNGYNNLYSKIGGINKKGKTDNKIFALLDFAGINKTEKIESLFPGLRNVAIHQGEVNVPGGDGYENQTSLELLLNEIIANIIQYRGIRYIKTEAMTNIVEKKETFNINYEKFGYKPVHK
jgi:hypothetical protein